MIKRRIDEDFKHVWAINWNGLPEDFSDATEIVLTASVYGKKKQLERGIDYVIEGNLIIVDFTPRFATIPGIYNLELKYIKPSDGFFDGERRSAIDIDVVQIVARSSQVTDTGDITSTSEAAFGFQGLSAYEVWLKDNPGKTKEDYFAYLQKPATDAIASIQAVEQTVSDNEALRIISETSRKDAEDLRLSAEVIRIENETERVSKESVRVENETERVSKESIRNENEVTRVSNENTRNENEAARVENETLRIAAETLRLEAELLRKSGETGRVNAEGLRVTAETGRVNAETERVTNINNLFENVNELTELETFDVSKKQRLIHELGILKWEDYE